VREIIARRAAGFSAGCETGAASALLEQIFIENVPMLCPIKNFTSKAFVLLSEAKDLAAAVFAAVMDFLTQPGPNHAAKKCRARSFAPQTRLRMTGIFAKLICGRLH
jgi:hypothetical protein